MHQIYSSYFFHVSVFFSACIRTIYFLTGPLTPAPITLGSSSLPIEYIMPMIVEMRKANATPVPTNSQN